VIPEPLQLALAAGFIVLLLLLRVDVRRFLVAEWDDDAGGPRRWTRRLAWLAAGLALVTLIFTFHPQPISDLRLHPGSDRLAALGLGLLYGFLGAGVAVLFAWLRYGGLRLPVAGRYPGAIVMAVGVAIVDEALFRGVVLGTILNLRIQPWAAILIAATVYAATLRGAGGRMGAGVVLIHFLMGVAGGILVVVTGGIGAGIVGLTMTRLALFAVSGRRGLWLPPRQELDQQEGVARPPAGWAFVPGDEDERRGVGRFRPG
jgi:hypothetical protein